MGVDETRVDKLGSRLDVGSNRWNKSLICNYVSRRESREKISCDGHRIGSRYKKALYWGFTDGTFKEPLPSPPWAGLLGPTIRAEVGDVLYIHFRNMAKVRNFSVHPHGLFYLKNSEGNLFALYPHYV